MRSPAPLVMPPLVVQPTKTLPPADGVAPAAPRQPTRDRTFGPDFEAKLDKLTQSKARAGNRAQLLFDGNASFSTREHLIAAATKTIHLQTYIFEDDETGWRTARLLAERALNGVKVRLIYDALGSKGASSEIFAFLRAAGVEVRGLDKTLPWQRLSARWHEKNLVVDGVTAVQGGMNIANEYSASGGSWLGA